MLIRRSEKDRWQTSRVHLDCPDVSINHIKVQTELPVPSTEPPVPYFKQALYFTQFWKGDQRMWAMSNEHDTYYKYTHISPVK